LQNGNEANYLAESESKNLEEKQQLLILWRFPGNGAKKMVSPSIVAIMLQLLGLPVSHFINPVVRTNLEATVLYAQVLALVAAVTWSAGTSPLGLKPTSMGSQKKLYQWWTKASSKKTNLLDKNELKANQSM
jgi:hypothetical protein